MKKLWITALFVILAIFILSSLAMALPKMYLSQDQFNFGYIPQNSKVSHVFWIKSVGEDSLKILKVVPG